LPRKGILRLLGFSFIMWLLPFHATHGKSYGIWPFFSYYESERLKEWEVLGPFFVWRETEEGREWGIRPFMYRTNYPSRDLDRTEFLYPLGKYQRSKVDRRFYVIPFSLFRDQETYPTLGRREKAYSILTVFWGETDRGERYGGFFPLTGHLKERFGRDEITFHLWPLYSQIKKEGETRWRILWPFISVSSGEAEGVYVWPLWGHKVRTGEYSKGFFLWPFYVYIDEDLDTDTPLQKRYYLPFYASIRSPQTTVDMVFPPIFFHQKNQTSNLEKWELWPILTKADGEGIRERKIFPLFRIRQEPDKERRVFLWPLYIYRFDRFGTEEQEIYQFLLINKHRKVRYVDTGVEAIDANLWPIFSYRRAIDGAENCYIFTLLPLRDQGMERNIYPLFWIYRYSRSPEGETLSDLLWGLYRRRTSPQGSSTQIAFLLRIEKKENGELCLSILEGLFRYERKQETRKVGFFYRWF
jgi:hypothetical protein